MDFLKMWRAVQVGMSTKHSEVMPAVHYREKDERGKHVGRTMYAIKNGLGEKVGMDGQFLFLNIPI
jgi:AGCS family alanine or glycine:cation symporter